MPCDVFQMLDLRLGELPRRVIGLLNKVQLCVFGCLTKEICIAIFLFAKWMHGFQKKAGWLATALYLTASVCLMRYYASSFDRHEPLPYPIPLTRSGLPRCIPAFHRRLIMARDERADKLVKGYLSFFTLSKLILVRKKENFQFETIVEDSHDSFDILLRDVQDKVVSLCKRYVLKLFETPLITG